MGGSRRAPEAARQLEAFPWLVSFGCLMIGLLIFFDATVPAMREKEILDQAEQRFGQQVLDLHRQKEDLAQRRRSLPFDPETLLVELDRQGLLPEEAIERYGPNAR